jgi:hypothetical protein
MDELEEALCPECDERLSAEDIGYMPVTRETSAFVCTECDHVIGFMG